MKKRSNGLFQSVVATVLAITLAVPSVNWALNANASSNSTSDGENVYFFFDNRIVAETNNVDYSVTQVTDDMKTQTNAVWDGDLAWTESETSEWNNTAINVKDGTPDWEQNSGGYRYVHWDGEKYQMWVQHVKAKSYADDDNWTQYIIDSNNCASYGVEAKGTSYGGDSIICYYESQDAKTWVRKNQGEYYYYDPDAEKVVDTNIVFIGGHGPSVTANENPDTSEPRFLLACQAEDGGSEQWNAAGNNGGGMGGGVAVSWSEDGIHWEVPITVSTYDNGNQFMQADTLNNVHWSAELDAYVVLTRMTRLAGEYSGGRGVLQLTSEDTLTSIRDLKTIKATSTGDYRQDMNAYWKEPKVALQGEDLYSQPYYAAVDYYEKGYYIGIAPMLDDVRTSETYGKVYSELVWSPDLKTWYYMDKGTPFQSNSTTITAELGSECYIIYAAEPVVDDEGIKVFYHGSPYMHSYSVSELEQYDPELWAAYVEHYGEELTNLAKEGKGWLQSKSMKYVSLDYDAFAGYYVTEGQAAGTVTTTPFKVTGNTLRVAASSAENISVSVLDAEGNVVDGFDNGTLNANDKDSKGRYAIDFGTKTMAELSTDALYSFQVTLGGSTIVYSIVGNIEAQEITLETKNENIQFYELGDVENANVSVVPYQALTYTSGNEDVAAVDADGNITAVGAGETTVTVATESGKSITISVNVRDVHSEYDRTGLWELREKTIVDVDYYTESMTGWTSGTFTFYNDVINALKEGAVLEIGYSTGKISFSGNETNQSLWFPGWVKSEHAYVDPDSSTNTYRYIGNPNLNERIDVTSDEMRWNASGNVVQITYETLNKYLATGWNNNRSTFRYQSSAATDIYYVRVGMRSDFEDRSNLNDLVDVQTVTEYTTDSFTLTEELSEALTWGTCIEISYEADGVLGFTDAEGNTVGTPLRNDSKDVVQITYEELNKALATGWNTAGNKINYKAEGLNRIYSVKVGTRASYKQNLLEFEGTYDVPNTQYTSACNAWSYYWLTFSDEMKALFKEGTMMEIGFTPTGTSFSDVDYGNNLFIYSAINENYGSGDRFFGALDRFASSTGFGDIIGNGMYYNSEGNVLQVSYDALAQYLSNPYNIRFYSNLNYTINYIKIGHQVAPELTLSSDDIAVSSVASVESQVVVSTNVAEAITLPYTDAEVLASDSQKIILDGTEYTASWYITGTNALELRIAMSSADVASKLARELYEVILPEGLSGAVVTANGKQKISMESGMRWQNTGRKAIWNVKTYDANAEYHYIDSARATRGYMNASNFWLGIKEALQNQDTLGLSANEQVEFSSVNILVDGQNYTSTLWCKKEAGNYGYSLRLYCQDLMGQWNDKSDVFVADGTESVYGNHVLVIKGDLHCTRNSKGDFVVAEGLNDTACSIEKGAYNPVVEYADSITVNGTAVDSLNLDKAGEYEVIINTYKGNTIQNIVCYVPGDVHVDDKLDSRDLVALKKIQKGNEAESKVAEYASDLVAKDQAVDMVDLIVMREKLVGTQEDRTNLDTLTNLMDVTGFTTILDGSNVWAAATFKITSEIKEKLQTGAVVEIAYECDNTLTWISDNQAMWFEGEVGLNNDKVKWNDSGTIVQVSYDTLNANLAAGWDSEGQFFNYYAGGPCVIKSIKIGMLDGAEGDTPGDDTPDEPTEDRTNLYTLTDIIELTDFGKTIDAAWGTAGVSLTAEAAAKLREGAVIEIVYECDVPAGSEWIGNKALWVAGNDADGNWQMIGYPGDGGVAQNELRWNESGTIVQITSDTLNQYRASDWNNDWAWFAYQAIGPCTITSIRIGTIVTE